MVCLPMGLFPGGVVSRWAVSRRGCFPAGSLPAGLSPGGVAFRWVVSRWGCFPMGLFPDGVASRWGCFPMRLLPGGSLPSEVASGRGCFPLGLLPAGVASRRCGFPLGCLPAVWLSAGLSPGGVVSRWAVSRRGRFPRSHGDARVPPLFPRGGGLLQEVSLVANSGPACFVLLAWFLSSESRVRLGCVPSLQQAP